MAIVSGYAGYYYANLYDMNSMPTYQMEALAYHEGIPGHHKRWTRQEAIDYLVLNTPNSVYDSTKAIERYIVMPGQATAYMIGKLKIVEIRENARTALGEKFDIREFHDEVLKDGQVPRHILEDKIDNWVERVKAS